MEHQQQVEDLDSLQLWPREAQPLLALDLGAFSRGATLETGRDAGDANAAEDAASVPWSLGPSLSLHQHDTQDAQWGLHSSVWSGGLALLFHLAQQGSNALPRGAVIVELGAGTGVVGIGVARLGLAQRVVLSDLPAALPLLRRNAAGNGADLQAAVDVCALTWGEGAALPDALIQGPSAGEDVELVVLGSDVVYKPNLFEDLLFTVMALLRAQPTRSKSLMATQFRGEAQAKFWASAAAQGLVVRLMATLAVANDTAAALPRYASRSELERAPGNTDIVDVYEMRFADGE